jgi:type II secretory pathway predicted ATPase ExeA
MYTHFFRLNREPFSISPDPRFLFMSHSHHEALAHLMYGANSGGGVVVLTGEIGAGKTTVCRCFLEQVPENCNVGYIFNPKMTVHELLRAICEEFHIAVPQTEGGTVGVKDHIDALNRFLLEQHAQGRNNVLIIDEAQNLAVEVLEQLRLLTNLETNDRKLLQIILIGQPELRDILARPDLEQLAQRVIARYHLGALTEQETASYIQHRLSTSGLSSTSPFQQPLMKQIQQLTRGVPRRINLLCDRALLGAYSMGKHEVDRDILRHAANELFATQEPAPERNGRGKLAAGVLGAAIRPLAHGQQAKGCWTGPSAFRRLQPRNQKSLRDHKALRWRQRRTRPYQRRQMPARRLRRRQHRHRVHLLLWIRQVRLAVQTRRPAMHRRKPGCGSLGLCGAPRFPRMQAIPATPSKPATCAATAVKADWRNCVCWTGRRC